MTTKTSITLSPIKRCYGSPNLKKRRLSSRKQQINLSFTIPIMKLPDLVNDILIEQQRRETIVNIATILRNVGDQMDERLQINNTSTIDNIFGQRTITFVQCLSNVLRFFL